MYIPEKRKNRQITLFDFNQSCGAWSSILLMSGSSWLAHSMEQNGSKMWQCSFPRYTGCPGLHLEWLWCIDQKEQETF